MTTSRCTDRFALLHARGKMLSTCVALAAIHTGGCAAIEPVDEARSVRVIVGFRPGTGSPEDAAFRERLAMRAGVRAITLIRAMSGDAWVMQMDCTTRAEQTSLPVDPDLCTAALVRLRAADPVVFVDVDRRETHR